MSCRGFIHRRHVPFYSSMYVCICKRMSVAIVAARLLGSWTMGKRTKPADLPLEAATDLFKNHLPMEPSPKLLWASAGPPSASKRPGVPWQTVQRLRPVLSDALDATGGRVMTQVTFTRQLKDHWISKGFVWAYSDVERCSYRIRAYLSSLLNFRRQQLKNDRKVPARWSELQSLLNKIHISDDEEEVDEELLDVQLVEDEYCPSPEVVELSSQEDPTLGVSTSQVDCEDLDEVERRLFWTPPLSKTSASDSGGSSATKAAPPPPHLRLHAHCCRPLRSMLS